MVHLILSHIKERHLLEHVLQEVQYVHKPSQQKMPSDA